jgi:hypothetical protein
MPVVSLSSPEVFKLFRATFYEQVKDLKNSPEFLQKLDKSWAEAFGPVEKAEKK